MSNKYEQEKQMKIKMKKELLNSFFTFFKEVEEVSY